MDIEKLRSLVDVCYETGRVYCKATGAERFQSPAAGGYLRGFLDGKRLYAHRVVFAHFHGYWPDHADHINGDRSDNRVRNLRAATARQNRHNSKAIGGCSPFKGVKIEKRTGKWVSAIMANGKKRHIGTFDSEIDAALAYNAAAQEIHGDYARLNEV